MVDRNREQFYKEYIKSRGYTLQGELGSDEQSVTYHVEYGEGFALQFVRFFQQEKYAMKMKEMIQNIKKVTQENPGLFLCYYEEEELEATSEYEAEIVLKIQYAINLKRYCGTSRFTLKELLKMGIMVTKAYEKCSAYNVEMPRIDMNSVFWLKDAGWRNGNFDFVQDSSTPNSEKNGDYGLPPEYYCGQTADEAGKVYELGILLYGLMNGMEMPYESECQNEWEAELLRRKAEILKAPKFGPESLKKIVCNACAVREKRYHTMKELREHLEHLMLKLPEEWQRTEITNHSYNDAEYITRDFQPKNNEPQKEISVEKEPVKPQKETIKPAREKKKDTEEEKKRKVAEKEKKKKQKENEKKIKDAQKAQKKEEEEKYGNQNRKDLFMILGIVAAFITVIVLVVVVVGNSKNNRIYRYIDSAAYATAMSDMEELYEEDKNIDEVAEYYVDACMSDREYKRIPETIDMFSEEYCQRNEQRFESIVQQMIDSGKERYAEKVLQKMEAAGGIRAEYAASIRQKLGQAVQSEQ